jgi:hypothetical protein
VGIVEGFVVVSQLLRAQYKSWPSFWWGASSLWLRMIHGKAAAEASPDTAASAAGTMHAPQQQQTASECNELLRLPSRSEAANVMMPSISYGHR